MVQRIAAALALIAFAVCLLIGGLEAGNPFTTTVWRALLAMGATLLVGMVLGTMAQAMINENLKMEQEKLKNSTPKTQGRDR
jgi:flagellar biosynthesis protein FliR